MSELEALQLVRRLLTEALARPDSNMVHIRDLAGRIGELSAVMRAAVTVIDQAAAEFRSGDRELSPEVLDWHRGAVEGDLAVCGAPQPGQPAFPCIWNRSAHTDHRDLLGRTWQTGGES